MRDLLEEVLAANRRIPEAGLATLTWGNVSGVDRGAGVYVIKPSGVPYAALTVESLVIVEIESGRVVGGTLKPSVDSETHRLLYQAFPAIGGITHTHSTSAVAFAQARRDIPVLGTTHADNFDGLGFVAGLRATGSTWPTTLSSPCVKILRMRSRSSGSASLASNGSTLDGSLRSRHR